MTRVSPPHLREAGDRQSQPEVTDQEDHDHENNKQREYDNLCRLCGKVLGDRTIDKSEKCLPAVFS